MKSNPIFNATWHKYSGIVSANNASHTCLKTVWWSEEIPDSPAIGSRNMTDEYSVQSRRGLCVKTGQLRVELIALKVV
jgi:hypothetical protein